MRCSRYVKPEPPAVANHCDQPRLIRPVYVDFPLAQRLNDQWVRMSVAVIETRRNDAETRTFQIEKLRGARSTAAVMAHLEYVIVLEQARARQFALDFFLHVACQK